MPMWYGSPAAYPIKSFMRNGTPESGPRGNPGSTAALRARS